MSAPQKSRTDALAERLDAHLATLSSDWARQVFLLGEFKKWEHRYGLFLYKAERGIEQYCEPGRSPPDAFDYVLTLAEISSRLTKFDKPRTDYDATLDAVREAVA